MEYADCFDLNFPAESGFSKTKINFFDGSPDLLSVYPQSQNLRMRLFVTDTVIFALDSLSDFFKTFTQEDKNVFVRADGNDVLIVLDSGECYKDIDHVLAIVKAALEHNFDRSAVFVGIGGGVISDMTAFAASMYKRGVDVEFVPTTLLSMVDASIGGKTGCDFESYKNMIGAFYPAKVLNVWPSFVKSLPQKEFISGLAEAIKTALLFSPQTVALFKDQKDLVLKRDDTVMNKIIRECAKDKASIVQKDLKEHGERAFLNLGHTFGHALESASGLGSITHGEAVAWGMARAAELSALKLKDAQGYADDTKNLLLSYGYDTQKKPALADAILLAMKKDKKSTSHGGLRVILQQDVAKTFIQEISQDEAMQVLK